MSKKTFLVLLGFVFLFSFNIARASLLINEVMYDLSGSDSLNSKSREWVEIYNPDSSKVDIDATKWRFYDGSNNRTINNETNFSISAMSSSENAEIMMSLWLSQISSICPGLSLRRASLKWYCAPSIVE